MRFPNRFKTGFSKDVMSMFITFGASGSVIILGSLIISRGGDFKLSADTFRLIALTNLVSFSLILPFEAIASRYANQRRNMMVYGSLLIPFVTSVIGIYIWDSSNKANHLGNKPAFIYIFSVAFSQTVNSILAGSGKFQLLARGSLLGLSTFILALPLTFISIFGYKLSVLSAFVISNIISAAFLLLYFFKERTEIPIIEPAKFGFKRFLELVGIYVALAISFGISTFIHNGGVLLSDFLQLDAKLVIEFSLTTTLLRIPFTILSTLGSPFRSKIRSLIESNWLGQVSAQLLKIEVFVLLISIPFSFGATLVTVLFLNFNNFSNGFLNFHEIHILSISEIIFFAASLFHIFNTFFLRGIYLVAPWTLALIGFLLSTFVIQNQIAVLIFSLFVASFVLFIAEVLISIISLRHLSNESRHILPID
jgi:hypothetical protein